MEGAVPATNLQEKARQGNFGSVGGGGGGGVARGVGNAGRPVRAIKRKCSVRGGGGGGVFRGAAGVRDMEKSVVRRPVYGGPARQEVTEIALQGNLAGGPGVLRTPGRRPPHRNGGTFGSFGHERTTIIRYVVKKIAAKLSRQVSCPATPARANKEKISVRGGGGCEVSRGVRGAGTSASQFWQRGRQESVRGFPQRGRRGGTRGSPQRGQRGKGLRGGAKGPRGSPSPAKSPCFPVSFHKI